MAKKRIYDLAKELEVDNNTIIDILFSNGITKENGEKLQASSNIENEQIELIKKSLKNSKTPKAKFDKKENKESKPKVTKVADSSKTNDNENKKKISSENKEKTSKQSDLDKKDKPKKIVAKTDVNAEIKKEEHKKTKLTHSKLEVKPEPEIKKEEHKKPKSAQPKLEVKTEPEIKKEEDVKKISSKQENKNEQKKSISLAIKEKITLRISNFKESFSNKDSLKQVLLTRTKDNSPLKSEALKPEKVKKIKQNSEIQDPYKKKIKELGSNEPPKDDKKIDDKKQVSGNQKNKNEKIEANTNSTNNKNVPSTQTIPLTTSDKFKKDKDKRDKKSRDDKKQREEEEKLLAKTFGNKKKKKEDKKVEEVVEENLSKEIEIYDGMNVKDIADKLRIKETDIIKELFMKGVMVTVNQALDKDLVTKIVLEKGFTIKEDTSKEDEILEMKIEEMSQDEASLELRPPVVTIMGHVDHGKTSLLDSIRKTKVTDSEAGGITQHIGAYQVNVHGRTITFLDTPGHEAFTALRARGAKATDIAVLVVAADDGVMPQTIEAMNHAKAASVPIIVAINKIDKPDSNPDKIKQQLAEYDLVAEDWGGSTVMVPVSARAKIGIDDLLEMILLTADIQEIKANPNKPAQGVIIESKLDKGKGPVATVLIQAGTLKVGDNFVVGSVYGKVRAMFNYLGSNIKEAGPSVPVQVIGYSGVPVAGELLKVVESDKIARELAEKVLFEEKEKASAPSRTLNLESISEQIAQGKTKELNVVIKGDAQGSTEALEQSLSKVAVEDIKLRVIHSAVGDVTEHDVTLAAASKGIIVAFNVKADGKTRELAEKEGIDIRNYNIIYRVIEDVQLALEGMLEPEYEDVMIGKVEVRAVFNINKNVIAGCYVTEGKITRNAVLHVIRNGNEVFKGKIDALKRFKDDVKEVATGFECGISIDRFSDIQQGDIFEAFVTQEKTRK